MARASASRRSFLRRCIAGTLSAIALASAGISLEWRGRRGRPSGCLRPPGALDEEDFLAKCIRCGRCADACPNRAIIALTAEAGRDFALMPGPGEHDTPVIVPRRQACILCEGVAGDHLLCTAACPSGALRLTAKEPETILAQARMGVAEVDTELCYSFNGASCGACVRACPFEGRALSAGMWEKPLLDPDYCVGCGLCERACLHYPQAIRVRAREVVA